MALAEPPIGVTRAAQPPPDLRFRRRVGLVRGLRDLWRSRAVIAALAERDIRARYKQALLGAAWVVVTPILLMIVFTVFVQRVADVDTGGIPYPLFSYVALLPWTFFSSSITNGSTMIRSNLSVVSKIACPREIFPFTAMATAFADGLVSLGVLGVLFAIFTTVPQPESIFVIPLFALQIVLTAGIVLIVAGVAVYVRDILTGIPLLMQFLLFATPVAYSSEAIAGDTGTLYAILNPLAPIIDGYRRCVLYGLAPEWDLIGYSAVTSLVLFVAGYTLFKRLETGFADVA